MDSLEILEQQGYINIKRLAGGVPRGIGVIQPTLNGFMVFAPQTMQLVLNTSTV